MTMTTIDNYRTELLKKAEATKIILRDVCEKNTLEELRKNIDNINKVINILENCQRIENFLEIKSIETENRESFYIDKEDNTLKIVSYMPCECESIKKALKYLNELKTQNTLNIQALETEIAV